MCSDVEICNNELGEERRGVRGRAHLLSELGIQRVIEQAKALIASGGRVFDWQQTTCGCSKNDRARWIWELEKRARNQC
jgi:hypothetical protein